MMDLNVESLMGPAHGERSALRTNQRNGYREPAFETRVGNIPPANAEGLLSSRGTSRYGDVIKPRICQGIRSCSVHLR